MKLSNAMNIVEAMITNNIKLAEQGASNASFLIPMLWSLPGEGKTTAVEDLADRLGFDIRTVIVAQFDAGELGGFPALDVENKHCLLYTSPSPRDGLLSRMPSSA